jgi:hypothetical protein
VLHVVWCSAVVEYGGAARGGGGGEGDDLAVREGYGWGAGGEGRAWGEDDEGCARLDGDGGVLVADDERHRGSGGAGRLGWSGCELDCLRRAWVGGVRGGGLDRRSDELGAAGPEGEDGTGDGYWRASGSERLASEGICRR